MKFIITLLFIFLLCSQAQAVELNSTIMLFNEDDLDQCQEQITKANKNINTRINFLTSIYAQLEKKKVVRYYLKNKNATVKTAKHTNIKRFQRKLKNCINKALKTFDHVHVTIQLNHVNDASNWRNHYDYDPLKKYHGHSLFDIAMKPFQKMKLSDLPRIHLALTAEMGTSIKLYPHSYSKIIKLLPKSLNVGISINYNKSFGSNNEKSLKLPVLNDFDFIGVSAYDKIKPQCSHRDFQHNIEKFRKKLINHGLSKPQKEWNIQITEIGIGGGASQASMISRIPYKGIYGPYLKKHDPWQKLSYRKIRKNFYKCLLIFLKNTDLVNAAFIWNANSWDVQGFYPFSSKYRNNEISNWISSHNKLTK